MSDAKMAGLARQLAHALNVWAKSRNADDLKEIALLHTQMCAAARAEDEQIKSDEAVSS